MNRVGGRGSASVSDGKVKTSSAPKRLIKLIRTSGKRTSEENKYLMRTADGIWNPSAACAEVRLIPKWRAAVGSA